MESDRTGAWIITGGMVLLIGVAAVLHHHMVSGRHQTLQSLQDQLRQTPLDQAAAQQLRDRREELALAARRFAREVPQEADLGRLLDSLGADLSAHDVVERDIATRASGPLGLLTRTPVSLRFRGSYEGLFSLLQQIEYGPRLIRVDRVVVHRQGEDVHLPLQVEVEFSTFSSDSQELISWTSTK